MSPIHDQSYRHYEGVKQPPGRGWSTILWVGIRTFLARRVFLTVMLVAWVPFIVRAVQIYVVTMYPTIRNAVPVDAKMFESFIEQQGLFVYFVAVYVGAGLIANDRRANALQIYLSKPLLRIEYIGGKLGILIVFLLEVTLAPALFLIMLQVMFSGSFEFLRDNAFVIPAVTLASILRVLVIACTMLALSSLSKSSRYAAILFTGALFFTEAVSGVVQAITGSTRMSWISISANLDQVTDAIFRQPLRYETPVVVCVLVLVGLIALSISVLERRVRGVEVVQ
jgi:ABC-type transport system involved in multi-copper enzyme maturation permease subunit